MDEIIKKLISIEQRLIEQNLLQKEIITFAEACLYLDLSSSHLYKLTSSNTIPCYCPQGKKLYFRRLELDSWLTRTRSASVAEVEHTLFIAILLVIHVCVQAIAKSWKP